MIRAALSEFIRLLCIGLFVYGALALAKAARVVVLLERLT